jgi:hypothetical protein
MHGNFRDKLAKSPPGVPACGTVCVFCGLAERFPMHLGKKPINACSVTLVITFFPFRAFQAVIYRHAAVFTATIAIHAP